MKLSIVVMTLVIVSLAACPQPKREEYYAPTCDTDKMASFIVDCAAAANPKADEEGEDLVIACTKTAVPIFCGPTCFRSYNGDFLCEERSTKRNDMHYYVENPESP